MSWQLIWPGVALLGLWMAWRAGRRHGWQERAPAHRARVYLELKQRVWAAGVCAVCGAAMPPADREPVSCGESLSPTTPATGGDGPAVLASPAGREAPLADGGHPDGDQPDNGLFVVKMHGLGNAYVFVDELTRPKAAFSDAQWAALARAVSDPHVGVGADGLILMQPGTAAPLAMRIFNADGSEGEMCGNGIRCLAMYAHQVGVAGTRADVETKAGLRQVEVVESPAFGTAVVRVDMGEPHSQGPGGTAPGQPLQLDVAGQPVQLWPVSVGNPHAVLFVDDVAQAPVTTLGPLLERHPRFPGRINVEFVEVVSPHHLRMRVWERGSGETQACGTGACASAVAAAATGRSGRRVAVELLGGTLEVTWDDPAQGGRLWMTGPARLVFQGYLTPQWLRWALDDPLGKERRPSR